jgi:branched-chain amino acid transport system substrate-binding protein
MQVLGQAIEGAKSTDHKVVGEYLHANTFDTIVGKVKFGANGEWDKARILLVQYQHIKGTDLSQFAGPGKRVVLLPEEWKSGTLIYPYAEALK